MFRYALLLVLAAPLGYIAYDQGYALLGLDKPAALKAASLEEPQATLNEVRESAEKCGVPSPDVQKALLSIAEECPDLSREGKEADKALVKPMQEHADNLKDVRRLFIGFAEIETDPTVKDRVRSGAYKGFLDNVLAVRDLKLEIDKLFNEHKRGDNPRPILDKLDEYARHPWRKEPFIKNVKAGLKRKDLPLLDPLSKKLTTVLSDPPRGQAVAKLEKEIEEAAVALEQFRDDPDVVAAPDHYTWARQQATRWRKCLDLLHVVEKDAGISAPADVAPHVEKYAALVRGAGLPPEVRPLVRQSAIRFCKGFLPRLAHDDNVLLESSPVARSKVYIVWKEKKAQALTEWQKDTGLDERDLATAKYNSTVNYYDALGKQLLKPIDATPRTKAAIAYNEALARPGPWPAALRGVLEVCESTEWRPLLTEPRTRVKAVLDAMTGQRDLFGGD